MVAVTSPQSSSIASDRLEVTVPIAATVHVAGPHGPDPATSSDSRRALHLDS